MTDAGKRPPRLIPVLLLATAGVLGLATWALWPHWQAHRAVRQLIASLPPHSDADWHAFDAAIGNIKRLGVIPAAVSQLSEILREPDAKTVTPTFGTMSTRSTACYALGRFGPDAAPAVSVLIKALTCDDTESRIQAARALGEIGPAAKEALPALREAEHEQIERNSPLVRRHAESAIKKIEGGVGATEMLVVQLQDSNNAAERALGARALARIGPDAIAAVPALTRALDDKDPEVREEATKALSMIDPGAGLGRKR